MRLAVRNCDYGRHVQRLRNDSSEYVYHAWLLLQRMPAISKELLQKALSEDIKDTYNMVSVDGDTSTNDTVLLLANGHGRQSCDRHKRMKIIKAFCEALHAVNA